jgi:hypothetical protein
MIYSGTVCDPKDETTYCVFSRNFHMLSMVLMILFVIDFLTGGTVFAKLQKRWIKSLSK